MKASVIIVSRHRPAALMRAIKGVQQQDHDRVELVIVADPDAAAQVQATGIMAKVVTCDQANISLARNLGIAVAAGEVLAFLDDDAVPEPTWLSRLVAPFCLPQVVAATGFVRGRNGISYQWRACWVDALGHDHPLESGMAASFQSNTPGRCVKTQGTNCAFRAQALRAVGGFDPAFRFYLDEADVNLRMAARGGLTAVVPAAQVHHGYVASVRRRGDRVPVNLHDIGASTMVFLRRHAPKADWAGALAKLERDQRARALRWMVDGGLEPAGVAPLMATLAAGIADGAERPLQDPAPFVADVTFLRLPCTGPRPGLVLSGRPRSAAALHRKAAAKVNDGHLVTLMLFGPTARAHRHVFHPDGYWLQQGGLFGRSDRSGPPVLLTRFATRVVTEIRRLSPYRPV